MTNDNGKCSPQEADDAEQEGGHLLPHKIVWKGGQYVCVYAWSALGLMYQHQFSSSRCVVSYGLQNGTR